MLYCHVANQIAIHADEPEQLSASEILDTLIDDCGAYFGGYYHTFDEITNSIDRKSMKEAVQSHMQGELNAIRELYINRIKEYLK